LIKDGAHNAFVNMAIDEAVLRARIEGLAPNTLRLYRWSPSAVSVGRFQKVESEVQVENCQKLGVDVVRRITGGGTVYHDAEREVTYSVVATKKDLGTEDITVIYGKIYSGLAEAARILGVSADFSRGDARNCPNLTVKGRKISGSAQAHRKGVVLQHGTLLVDVDLEAMFTLLRVPWARTCLEVADVARNKITSMRKELDRSVSTDEVAETLAQGFEKALDIKLTNGELTPHEHAMAESLCRQKYATAQWNLNGTSSQNP